MKKRKIYIRLILFTIMLNIVANKCYCQIGRILNDSINKVVEVRINPYFYISSNPIPFKDIVKFKLFGLFTIVEKEIEFKIFNIYGIEVIDLLAEGTKNNNGETTEVTSALRFLPSGVYLAR